MYILTLLCIYILYTSSYWCRVKRISTQHQLYCIYILHTSSYYCNHHALALGTAVLSTTMLTRLFFFLHSGATCEGVLYTVV